MIGKLPTTLKVDNIDYEIRTDYRDILVIMQACMDDELSDMEKIMVVLSILFKNNIPKSTGTAYEKALWFLDGGQIQSEQSSQNQHMRPQLYDWEQDEQIIFSAINKIAGYEVRDVKYMHWWTFIGLFNEIGEGMFSTVVRIREKKAKHKKLEKWERTFYNENKDIIDLKKRKNKRSQAEKDALDALIG